MKSTKNKIICWAFIDLNETGPLWTSLSAESLFETKKEVVDYLTSMRPEEPKRWKPVRIKIEILK